VENEYSSIADAEELKTSASIAAGGMRRYHDYGTNSVEKTSTVDRQSPSSWKQDFLVSNNAKKNQLRSSVDFSGGRKLEAPAQNYGMPSSACIGSIPDEQLSDDMFNGVDVIAGCAAAKHGANCRPGSSTFQAGYEPSVTYSPSSVNFGESIARKLYDVNQGGVRHVYDVSVDSNREARVYRAPAYFQLEPNMGSRGFESAISTGRDDVTSLESSTAGGLSGFEARGCGNACLRQSSQSADTFSRVYFGESALVNHEQDTT